MDQLIDRISQIVSPLLAEALAFVPPVDCRSPANAGRVGSGCPLLLLLLVRVRRKRTMPMPAGCSGRKLPLRIFPPRQPAMNPLPLAARRPRKPRQPGKSGNRGSQAGGSRDGPRRKCRGTANRVYLFKRKSAATEPRSAPAHDMSSGGDANGADAADAAGDDAVLAGLEQEMLARGSFISTA